MTSNRTALCWRENRGDIEAWVKDAGWHTVIFDTSAEAEALIRDLHPAVVLVHLSGVRAAAMIGQIRTVQGGSLVPIIAVGGPDSQIRNPVEAIAILGVDGFCLAVEGPAKLTRILEKVVGPQDAIKESLQLSGSLPGKNQEHDAAARTAEVSEKTHRDGLRISDRLRGVVESVERRLFPQVEASQPCASEVEQELIRNELASLALLGLGSASATREEWPILVEASHGPVPMDNAEATTAFNPQDASSSIVMTGPDCDSTTQESIKDIGELSVQEKDTVEIKASDVSDQPVESKSDLAPGQAASGHVSQMPVPRLMALAMAARLTGCITFSRDDVVRRVFISEGQPVLATSEAESDRLVDMLRREGRLGERQHQIYNRLIGESGRKAGVILVEQGLIKPRDLFPLIRRHYEEILYDCFTWETGTWAFEPSQPPEGERIRFDLHAGAIILEGVRRRLGGREAIRRLGGERVVPVRNDTGLCNLDDTGLLPEECQVLDLSNGDKTLDGMASMLGESVEDVAAVVLGLYYLGHLRLESRVGVSGNDVTPIGEGFQSPKTHQTDLTVEQVQIEEHLEIVREGTYFAVLGVSPDANGHAIRQAYRLLRRKLSSDHCLGKDCEELLPMVEEIRFAVEEAYEILRDPALRDKYRQACEV